MPYKMPIRREKAAKRLASALKAHGELIAKELEPRIPEVLEEGEEMPDVAHLLDVLGRIVLHESQGLDAADDARSKEGAQVRWIRKQLRERVEPELRERVVTVRGQMRQFFGAKETNLLLGHAAGEPTPEELLQGAAAPILRRIDLDLERPPETRGRCSG